MSQGSDKCLYFARFFGLSEDSFIYVGYEGAIGGGVKTFSVSRFID